MKKLIAVWLVTLACISITVKAAENHAWMSSSETKDVRNVGIENNTGSGERTGNDIARTFLEDIKVSYQEKEKLSYCILDLDQDGNEELILRSVDLASWGEGQYIYKVYRINSRKRTYDRVPWTAFYSIRSESCVAYWPETKSIAINVTMGEVSEYELLEFNNGRMTDRGTTNEDLSRLPLLDFILVEADNNENKILIMDIDKERDTILFSERGILRVAEGEPLECGLYKLDKDDEPDYIMHVRNRAGQEKWYLWLSEHSGEDALKISMSRDNQALATSAYYSEKYGTSVIYFKNEFQEELHFCRMSRQGDEIPFIIRKVFHQQEGIWNLETANGDERTTLLLAYKDSDKAGKKQSDLIWNLYMQEMKEIALNVPEMT